MNTDRARDNALQGEPAVTVDARGLPCPQPLLAMRRALREQPAGTLLCVLATDPGSWRDFHSFAELSGRPLLKAERGHGEFHYWLRAGALGHGEPNAD
ncbi:MULTISPECIES: sulfurtransferase TusA family protein [Microbulbifer]|uniref:sulfurtransferase TusA family protein n=1 Tax=Microbulbifer TaxID=48073 RepID=UPI001F2EE124|nr:sulfurtransferase TusA family protein [Microbulbifer zhoushanensis]